MKKRKFYNWKMVKMFSIKDAKNFIHYWSQKLKRIKPEDKSLYILLF